MKMCCFAEKEEEERIVGKRLNHY